MRRILLAAGVLIAGSSAAGAQEVELGPITAQLYYKQSGRLSDDLLSRDRQFAGWNTIIGAGDAEEPAEDLLVAVALKSVNHPEAFLEETLELWVTNEAGVEIARRNFSGLLVPKKGRVVNPLWLSDVGCAGLLTFHARFRGEEKHDELALNCGE